MAEVRWSPDLSTDYPGPRIRLVGWAVDEEDGSRHAMVRRANGNGPRWLLTEDEWERLAPVDAVARDGAA